MDTRRAAAYSLAQEMRAMLTRVARVRPFALQETMVPAAGLQPQALIAIERLLLGGRRELLDAGLNYLSWLRGPGRFAEPAEMQRRLVVQRLRFNDLLAQWDTFAAAITQRSEAGTGVWLSGLDVIAADALKLPPFFDAPPVICYLDRGPGAAIRRARTRLPGGASTPVAIIKMPRERMVGHGIGSSLVHEVGHQAAALLGLVPSLRRELRAQAARDPRGFYAWRMWERWISEIVADLWAIGRIGISSTQGLVSVVSLPSYFVFRIDPSDPHPPPWIRVMLSAVLGEMVYPDPQWQRLRTLWGAYYPPRRQSLRRRRELHELQATMPAFARLLLSHQPASLHGHRVGEVVGCRDRTPAALRSAWRGWRADRRRAFDTAPSRALAVIGQARADAQISAPREARLVGQLLTHWALRSTLDIADICAVTTGTPADDRRRQSLETPRALAA
jgi:hypothetical protein